MNIFCTGIRGLPPKYGGFERHIDNLVKSLTKEKISVIVACENNTNNRIADKRYLDGVTLRYYRLLKVHRYISETIFDIYTMFKASKDNSIDIIYYCGISAGFATFIPRLYNKKIIVNVDGFEWKNKKFNSIVRALLLLNSKFLLLFPNILITDNITLYNYYGALGKKKVRFIPYSTDIQEDMDEEYETKVLMEYGLHDKQYFITITRLEKMNSIEYIILEHKNNLNEYILVVVGDLTTTFGQYITSKYQNSNIIFIDFISNKETLSILRKNALLYIHGQVSGGTSPALTEALASGCVIIAYDCPSNRSTLFDTNFYFWYDYDYYLKNNQYFENGNNKSLSKIIDQVMHIEIKNRNIIKTQNTLLAKNMYSHELITKKHIDIYYELVNKNG